jgi:membrane fusion protein, multidrug efflux system
MPEDHSSNLLLESPAKPTSNRRWRWWLALAVVAIAAGGGAFYYFQGAPNAKVQAGQARPQFMAPVITTQARLGDIGVYIEALGVVTPVYTATITGRVQGEILSVDYKEGQLVHKGDPLLQIDPRPYEAALTQVEGQFAHDQAVLSQARIDLERYKTAYTRNAIPKQQLDDQEQIVLQDEGTVKADTGMVESARVNLGYCRLKAPFDGRVGLRLVDPGNIVQANSTTALAVITQLQPITVIFSVSEDHLGDIQQQMRQGHPMSVELWDRARTKKIATGTLLTIDNQVDTATGTVKLKALVPNKDEALFANQFVNVRLLVSTLHDAVLIPTPAIQRNAQGAFAYLITPELTASMRPIKVGTTDGDTAAVEGLAANDVVAVNGFDKLQDGMKVVIRNGGPQGAPSAGVGPNPAAGPMAGTSPNPGAGAAPNPGTTPGARTAPNPAAGTAPAAGGRP